VRTRLAFLLAAFLAAPSLHAQLDQSTLAGRVLNRRFARLESDPAVKQLSDAGLLGFDDWKITAMTDADLSTMVRLMATGIRRVETTTCPEALAGGDGDAAFVAVLAGITDSMEAEAWADLTERAVWTISSNQPEGALAPPDVLQARMEGLVAGMSPEDSEIFQAAAENPGRASCMILRAMLDDLAKDEAAVAGPRIRGIMGGPGGGMVEGEEN
jgi:hypothetical protein